MSHDEMFELGGSYDEMLQSGLDLAGESKDYFIQGRLDHLQASMRGQGKVTSILDFACGVGDSSTRLADAFHATRVTGVDVATGAIDEARRRTSDTRVQFALIEELPEGESFDLCYVNGAYHHMTAAEQDDATRQIHDLLRPGGTLALFENNPWSIPARLVMRRIPFDRNAVMLWPRGAKRLLRNAGFVDAKTSYLFVFPRRLDKLRGVERSLRHIPIGAQYAVIATRP